MRILVTGGSGRLAVALGSEFLSHPPKSRSANWIHTPGKLDLNVVSFKSCIDSVRAFEPDIIIHAAAVVSAQATRDRMNTWKVNVCGTENITDAAIAVGARLVYISTDYVFDGENDGVPYTESDTPNPINFYGITKLLGEQQALRSPKSLVLRVPFRYAPWPYESAFVDQWTSARWIHEVAPDIIRAAQMDVTGILHIGGPRRSTFEMAREIKPDVKAGFRQDWKGMVIPRDTSLDSSKWGALCRS